MNEDEIFQLNLEGLPKDYKFDPKRRRKHTVIKPEDSTVQISLKIEGDLLDKLKKVANQKGLGYQTLLKQLVRTGLDQEDISSVIKELLSNVSQNLNSIHESQKKLTERIESVHLETHEHTSNHLRELSQRMSELSQGNEITNHATIYQLQEFKNIKPSVDDNLCDIKSKVTHLLNNPNAALRLGFSSQISKQT